MPEGNIARSEYELLEAYAREGYVMDRQETQSQSVEYSLSKNNKRILTASAGTDGILTVALGTDISNEDFVKLTQEYFRRINEKVPDYPFDVIETNEATFFPSSDSSTLFIYAPNEHFGNKPSKINVTIPSKKFDNEQEEYAIHLGGFVEGATKDVPRDLIKIVLQHTVNTGAKLSPLSKA